MAQVLSRRAALLMMVMCSGPAVSQQLYKCGNTYSQTPCAPDAKVKRVYANEAPDAPAGLTGYELCAAGAPKISRSPEPESVRVQANGARRSEVIQYAGQPVAAFRYDLLVDAKTEYGVFTGLRPYACWLSEDQRRILQFLPVR